MSLNLLSIMDGTKTIADGFSIAEMGQVVVLGVGIVFFGLVCIVLLSSIMSSLLGAFEKSESKASSEAVAPVTTAEPIANKQELVAVVSAVIAEEMGTDVEAIRIKSIKRI